VANKTVVVNQPFTYSPYVYDEDNYAVIMTLTQAPAGMTIDGNIISWVPIDIGNYTVTVQASDGQLYNRATFTIEVISG